MNWAGKLLIMCIRVYQRGISPLLPPSCRFYPSCSEYARQAISLHGAIRGSWLAICRLLKCHPFHPGGVDLVPGTINPLGQQDESEVISPPEEKSRHEQEKKV